MTSYYDISVPIHAKLPVWPDNPPVEVVQTLSLERGDVATVSQLTLGSHTGTHVDACCHFLPDMPSVSEMDLQRFIGPCLVLEITDPTAITRQELEQLFAACSTRDWPKACWQRILFKTQNSEEAWFQKPFSTDYVYLEPDAAAFLVERSVQLVGIDYLSVEGYRQAEPMTHRLLLAEGMHILEGLYLGHVPTGPYELICLPLLLQGGDGAPARAVLRDLGGND